MDMKWNFLQDIVFINYIISLKATDALLYNFGYFGYMYNSKIMWFFKVKQLKCSSFAHDTVLKLFIKTF